MLYRQQRRRPLSFHLTCIMLGLLLALVLFALSSCALLPRGSNMPLRPKAEEECVTLDGRRYRTQSVCDAINRMLWAELVKERHAN